MVTKTITVWDLDADEIIEMEIDEEALEAMDKAEEEHRKRMEEAFKEERRNWIYARDEDD